MKLIVTIVVVLAVLYYGLPVLERVLAKKAQESSEHLKQAEARLHLTQDRVSGLLGDYQQFLRTCSWDGRIAPWNVTYAEEKLMALDFSKSNARQKVNEYVEKLGLKIEQLDMSYYIPRNQNDNARMTAMRKIYKSMREKGIPIEKAQRVYHYNFPEVSKDDIMVRLAVMEMLDDSKSSE